MTITTIYLSDGSRFVLADGKRDHEGRIRYAWEIRGADMRVIARGEDLRSGRNAPVDHAGMQQSFSSFVSAWIEASPDSENGDLFPDAMRDWADANESELWMLTHSEDDFS